MRNLFIFCLISLCSCVALKDRKKPSTVGNSYSMDTIFVKGVGVKKKYSLNEIGEIWRSDTFGCKSLRAQIFLNDSNFTKFIYSLTIKEIMDYLGQPNYIKNYKSSKRLISYIIYITEGSTNWCGNKKYKNHIRIKYVIENFSYTGVKFYFDKNGKLTSYDWSLFG